MFGVFEVRYFGVRSKTSYLIVVVFLNWGVLEHTQARAQIPENPNTRDGTGMAVLASPFYFLGGRNPPPLFVVMFC